MAFREIIAATKPSRKVEFTVLRGGQPRKLTATLDEAQDLQAVAQRMPQPERPKPTMSKLGARIETVTPELEKKYNLGSGPAGAVIVEVEPLEHAFGDEFSAPVAAAYAVARSLVMQLATDVVASRALPVLPLGGRRKSSNTGSVVR